MEHLTPLNAAGIKVTAVDANALALRNILFRGVGVPEEEVVVVDIGAGNMEINIFKNGVLRFSRCLETGGIDMTRLVADHLRVNINEAESVKRSVHVRGLPGDDATAAVIISRIDALLMEIRRSIEYYKATFREKGVVRAILAGGTFLMSDLPEYFSESLGLPVECCDPFVALDCSDALKEEFGPQALRFATAVGLALRKA